MKRTIFMKRNVYRNGSGFIDFLTSAITGGGGSSSQAVGSIGNLGSNDPGNSIGGGSHLEAVSVQAEVTSGHAFKPVAVIEQTFRGWKVKKNALFELMDSIEREFSILRAIRPLFHRENFSNTNTLQLYQVEAVLLMYPDAIDQLVNFIFSRTRSNREVFSWLAEIYGWEKLRFYCAVDATRRIPMPNIWYGDRSGRICSPSWINIVMEMRKSGLSSDPREKVEQLQTLVQTLMGNVRTSEFLKAIDTRHYFFSTRISGFRGGDVNGNIDYTSDTVGQFDNELGMGVYRDISSDTGISAFEIYGRFFTDGM
jgi:hypothetical protein